MKTSELLIAAKATIPTNENWMQFKLCNVSLDTITEDNISTCKFCAIGALNVQARINIDENYKLTGFIDSMMLDKAIQYSIEKENETI